MLKVMPDNYLFYRVIGLLVFDISLLLDSYFGDIEKSLFQ